MKTVTRRISRLENRFHLRSLGYGLDEKALDAVAQRRFRPATNGGRRFSVQSTVQVSFKLL